MTLLLNRRQALAIGASAAAVALLPLSAVPAFAANNADDMIKKFTGGKAPTEGKVKLDLPEIAENGNTVPMTVTVDSPMTDASHVQAILIVADGNPNAGVATALPGSHGASRAPASASRGPAARWIAPSTPPPPSSDSFAAVTMMSTSCRVMSPRTTPIIPVLTSVAADSLGRLGSSLTANTPGAPIGCRGRLPTCSRRWPSSWGRLH